MQAQPAAARLVDGVESAVGDKGAHARVTEEVVLRRPVNHLHGGTLWRDRSPAMHLYDPTACTMEGHMGYE